MGIKDFLINAKTHLDDGILVIGNESADLDSICCAIAQAIHLTETHSKAYIPVVNAPKKVVKVRGEVIYVLGLFDISIEELIYLSDIKESRNRSLILVDHNEPVCNWYRSPPFEFYSIVGIIDHHSKSSTYVSLPSLNFEIIESCASCASLLVVRFGINSVLLWYPIIWDSMNFSFRVSNVDLEAHHQLSNIAYLEDGAKVFSNLEKASNLITEYSLPFDLLFQKDYKLYRIKNSVYYGMSTIHVPLFPDSHLEITSSIPSFVKDESITLFAINACYRTEEQKQASNDYSFKQQILIWYPKLHYSLGLFVKHELQWQLLYNTETCSIWQQLATNAGRKQLQPLIEKYLYNAFA